MLPAPFTTEIDPALSGDTVPMRASDAVRHVRGTLVEICENRLFRYVQSLRAALWAGPPVAGVRTATLCGD